MRRESTPQGTTASSDPRLDPTAGTSDTCYHCDFGKPPEACPTHSSNYHREAKGIPQFMPSTWGDKS